MDATLLNTLWPWARYALAVAVAFGVAFWVTPVFRDAAIKFGIVDKPNTPLKRQKEPVPYLGGLAVYVAFLSALALLHDFDHSVLAILLPATGLVLLGLMDDFGVIRPWPKLFWQVFAVSILIKAGIYIKLGFLPMSVNVGLTMFWLVGCINAVNIIDIMDGLASSVAMVAAIALFGFAMWCGRDMVAMMALALAGSLMGFLVYNRQPARIYLGDAGSMLIGFMVGALAINNAYTRVSNLAAIAPVLVVGVPVFDTAFVSVIRLMRGRNPMHGSPDHFALRLKKLGWPVNHVVTASVLAQCALCAVAVAVTLLPMGEGAIVLGAASVVALGVALWLARIPMPYPDDLAHSQAPHPLTAPAEPAGPEARK